jgi:ribosomal protein L29
MVQSIVNERDMYRQMTERGSPSASGMRTPSPQRLDASKWQQVAEEGSRSAEEVQHQFDELRKEVAEYSKTVQTQLVASQKESSEYRVQFAQAKTQLQFMQGANSKHKLMCRTVGFGEWND